MSAINNQFPNNASKMTQDQFIKWSIFQEQILEKNPKPEWLEKDSQSGAWHIPITTLRPLIQKFFPIHDMEITHRETKQSMVMTRDGKEERLFEIVTVLMRFELWIKGEYITTLIRSGTATQVRVISKATKEKTAQTATSYAEKNAIYKLGKFFGRDLLMKKEEQEEMNKSTIENVQNKLGEIIEKNYERKKIEIEKDSI